MALTARKITVTNAIQAIATPATEATASSPQIVTVANRHATETLYLGGPDVNATDKGFPVLKDEAFDVQLAQGDILYAFAAAANDSVVVIRRVR